MIFILFSLLIITGCVGDELRDESTCNVGFYEYSECKLCHIYNMKYDNFTELNHCTYVSCLNGTEKVIFKQCEENKDAENSIAGAIIISSLLK